MLPDDIIVLVGDCLRSGERDLLTGLERRSDLQVPDCYASATWTLPAHATLLSGEQAYEHDVVRRGSEFPADRGAVLRTAREAGFTTALVSENGIFGSGNGFDAGMDIVDEDVNFKRYPTTYSPAQTVSSASAGAALKAVRGALASDRRVENLINTFTTMYRYQRDPSPTDFPHHGQRILDHLSTWMERQRRLFAAVNVLDTHNPHYCPPDRGCERAGVNLTESEIVALEAASDNKEYLFGEGAPSGAQSQFESWDDIQQRMHDVYRAQAAYVDILVSDWFDRHEDRLSEGLVVVVGDHGQLFGEEGMVGHHTSLHPHGVAVPAFVSVPNSWTTASELNGPVSMAGLAKAVEGAADGTVTDGDEFCDVWQAEPVVSCADGPTWRADNLRERYGPDHPTLAELEVRKLGIIDGEIQSVYTRRWGDSEIETATYRISPDGRERTDTIPTELTDRQEAWLRGGSSEQGDTDVSERLKMLGYR